MPSVGRPEPLDGYERFFGFTEAPFSLAPNPRFLFASAAHGDALAQVAYALERREPVVVITGEIGSGKTLLCRTVVQRLPRQTFLSVITDPRLDCDDLLTQLLQDFGVISTDRTRPRVSRHALVQTLQAFLASLVPIQAHAVVLIDEAQHVQPEVLEQIRLLATLDDTRGTMLQILLVGQTDMDLVLARPELRPLQQRVSRRFQLQRLTADEVQHYIAHRIALASTVRSQAPGARELARALAEWDDAWDEANAGVVFTPDAVQAVSTLAGGLPRVINLLCDRALEAAYAQRQRVIDGPVIHRAADALGLAPAAAPTGSPANGTSVELDAVETFTRLEPAARDASVPPTDEVVPLAATTRERPVMAIRLRWSLVATALVVAVGSIWWGVRPVRPPTSQQTQPAQTVSPASSVRTAPSTRPDPVPTEATPSLQLEPAATGTSVQIVVASFHTDARAAAVAADVAALGLPTQRRASNDWQQVLVGPFASRAEAEDAQERLDRAGFTGTQIIPTAP